MSQDLITFLRSIDIKSQTRGNYTSTFINQYENISTENYLQLCIIAIEQHKLLTLNENLSGFYLVDWRANFSSLNTFIETTIEKESINDLTKEFLNCFNSSAEILYSRLGLEY
jgi:hypothetical protein